MATDIARHFAAACGEADQDGAFQAKRFDESREVVSVGVHIVATPRLARPAMPTTVMGDAAIALGIRRLVKKFRILRAGWQV